MNLHHISGKVGKNRSSQGEDPLTERATEEGFGAWRLSAHDAQSRMEYDKKHSQIWKLVGRLGRFGVANEVGSVPEIAGLGLCETGALWDE